MAVPKRSRVAPVDSGDEGLDEAARHPRRHATVFDATAGRVSQDGFIPKKPVPSSKNSEFVSAATLPVRPDEVLFRQRNAPPRYAESDYYFAHSRLDEAGRALPKAELVKALHGYIAHHFERTGVPAQSNLWKSMDETALLALGVLMEETARSLLGDTGDLVFVEAGETEEDEEEEEEEEAGAAGAASDEEAAEVPSEEE